MRHNFKQVKKIRFIPQNGIAQKLDELNAIIYQYEKENKLYAIAYQGKSTKKAFHDRFANDQHRQEHIKQWINTFSASIQQKKERVEARKNFKHTLKAGQILCSTWGYDQTNVDFYEVIAIKSSKSVIIRELASQQIADAFMQGNALPQQGQYINEPMLKRVVEGNRIKIKNHRYASPWHGRPERFSSYA